MTACVCPQELFEVLPNKLRAGKPGFHRASYMVQENNFFNIPASSEVRLNCLSTLYASRRLLASKLALRAQSLRETVEGAAAGLVLNPLLVGFQVSQLASPRTLHSSRIEQDPNGGEYCNLSQASVGRARCLLAVTATPCHMRSAELSLLTCSVAPLQPVEVLWIHNQQWEEWERRLPQDTQERLLTDRKGRGGTCKGVNHKMVMEREPKGEESMYGGVSCYSARGPIDVACFVYSQAQHSSPSTACQNVRTQII